MSNKCPCMTQGIAACTEQNPKFNQYEPPIARFKIVAQQIALDKKQPEKK